MGPMALRQVPGVIGEGRWENWLEFLWGVSGAKVVRESGFTPAATSLEMRLFAGGCWSGREVKISSSPSSKARRLRWPVPGVMGAVTKDVDALMNDVDALAKETLPLLGVSFVVVRRSFLEDPAAGASSVGVSSSDVPHRESEYFDESLVSTSTSSRSVSSASSSNSSAGRFDDDFSPGGSGGRALAGWEGS